MKEQIIIEILHCLPDYTSEQLTEIKDAIRMVLCRYNVTAKETSLQVINNSSLHYLKMYLESCEQAGKSQGTIQLYQFHLSHLLSYLNKDILNISDDDIYEYLYNYRHKRTVSNAYLNQLRLIYNGFFKWTIKKRIRTTNPVEAVDSIKYQKKVKKPLSAGEVELLRSSCQTERDLAIVECLYSTAVRAFELLQLNRNDISFNKDDIIVLGKGNKERITYLNARAHIHLKNYLDSRTDDNPALFVSCKSPHERLTRRGLEDIINRISSTAGVEKVHPHRFRRTSATDLLNAGMPIEQVQELLGHKSIETTRIYCTVSQEAVKHNHKRYMNF
ncbi:MAG: tyrosine-type recombinase/integrase [Eubacterium sp.]|nr:tyrosine-type recombinase/integrase [Eubacterium sp.]